MLTRRTIIAPTRRSFFALPLAAFLGRLAEAQARPLHDSPVGELLDREHASLWQLARAIGERWQLTALTEAGLRRMVDLKTQSPPSYLAEYRATLAMLGPAPSAARCQAWLDLVLAAEDEETDIASARQFVVGEFVNLHLINGGFKTYGGSNYRGYLAGPRTYARASGAE